MRKSSRIDLRTLDALSAAIAIIDGEGVIIAVNEAWRAFAAANHPNPELVCEGANYLAVCDSARGPDAALATEVAAALRAMARGERGSLCVEYPCHSPDAQRWFCARATIFPGDRRARIVIAHEDITERKLAELQLRKSEHRYRGLFENSILGISETDVDGRLVSVNPAFARLYGFESPDQVIREVADVGSKLYDDPERRTGVLAELAKKGYIEPKQVSVRRRDGTGFPILVSAWELRSEEGELLGYQANHIDISQLKRAEDELRASREQMRALASRAQSAFEEERTSIARTIHDLLSQTLTRLKIDLIWLQRRLERPDGTSATRSLIPRVAEMAGMADEAVATVQRIATELRPAVLDSMGLGAALAWLAWDLQKRDEIACRARVPEGDIPIDRAVATAAFRIAQESLANVVRHSRATEAEIELTAGSEQLVLRIRDDGIGIDRAKLTDPFSIGLAGMRERAALQGGRLEILSEPGSGTIVEARFPLNRPASPAEGGL
jgi:PAS domain S-box-containing protein